PASLAAHTSTALSMSKETLTDITNPLNPISLGGNLNLQVTMTDAGEPGNNDSIGISLWNGSTLLFSSKWNGAQTVEQLLNTGNGNGNLVAHQLQVLGAPVSSDGSGSTLTQE